MVNFKQLICRVGGGLAGIAALASSWCPHHIHHLILLSSKKMWLGLNGPVMKRGTWIMVFLCVSAQQLSVGVQSDIKVGNLGRSGNYQKHPQKPSKTSCSELAMFHFCKDILDFHVPSLNLCRYCWEMAW